MKNFKDQLIKESNNAINEETAFRVVKFDDGYLTFSKRKDTVILGVIVINKESKNKDLMNEVVSIFCDIMNDYLIITVPITEVDTLKKCGFIDVSIPEDKVPVYIYGNNTKGEQIITLQSNRY